MMEQRECPKCGMKYCTPPALSRVDNKTKICPDCGTREALEIIGMKTKDQDSVLDTIHGALRNKFN